MKKEGIWDEGKMRKRRKRIKEEKRDRGRRKEGEREAKRTRTQTRGSTVFPGRRRFPKQPTYRGVLGGGALCMGMSGVVVALHEEV